MRTILIIDDNDVSRILLKEIFGDINDVSFLESPDGKEAIALFREHIDTIDMVLLDIRLPGCDGWDVIKIIKLEKPSIPVIAISAMHPLELSTRYAVAGFDNYLTKPICVEEVRSLVLSYLYSVVSLLLWNLVLIPGTAIVPLS